MKKQFVQFSLIALSLAMTVEARSFDQAPTQALLRRGATVEFSRGFQPTEAQPRFARRVATPDVSVNQPALHAEAERKPLSEVVGQVENLPHNSIALKTPELYAQCAQPLKDAASANAALATLKDASAKKRIAAADALAKSCEARAVEPLLATLKEDKDAEVRLAAAAALGKLGSVESVDPMIEALSDADARVRAQLGHSLGSFTVHRARNAVLNVLVNPGGATITDAADLRARCLGILVVNQMIDVRFSRKAIGFLFGFLDHQDPQLKAIAEATAVELQNTRNGLRELMGIIKVHNYPDFRRKAVEWLGRWGDPEARDLLTETAANDRDASVKAAATEALSKLRK